MFAEGMKVSAGAAQTKLELYKQIRKSKLQGQKNHQVKLYNKELETKPTNTLTS